MVCFLYIVYTYNHLILFFIFYFFVHLYLIDMILIILKNVVKQFYILKN